MADDSLRADQDVSDETMQSKKDMAMSADELIEDFALGVIGVCDENLKMNKRVNPNYPDGDEIDYNDLYQSCIELFHPLSTKEDAMEAVEGWVEHERWCVRALARGAKYLLEHGSFNFGPITGEVYVEGEEVHDDFDCFVDFADSVR